MIGCLRTHVRKQPIIALYFESENELKIYNLEARNIPEVIKNLFCFSTQLIKALDDAMLRLHQIWDRIGIGKTQKDERSSTVLRHLQSLLDDMVEEEESLERQIMDRVQTFTDELKKLTSELEVPAYHVSLVQSLYNL